MGDATPTRDGTAAGEDAAPDFLNEAQEQKLLTGNALEGLGRLRWNWGDAYAIGMLAGKRLGTYGALRRDGTGVLLASEDPEELTLLIRADYSARPVPRETGGTPQEAPAP